MEIGKKLKIYRELKGFTQGDIAGFAGIDEKYYGRVERGESNPTINVIEKICNALGIQVLELFLMEQNTDNSGFVLSPKISKLIVESLKQNIDIHINREVIFNGCESCIWYNGFIGSLNFDEFEMRLYAKGNIKAKLYVGYKEVLNLNGRDIYIDLSKYVSNDEELSALIEYMPYDEQILKEKSGRAFFIEECNWLTATLVDNQRNEILYDEIILDTDNIFEGLTNSTLLFDYIFKESE